MDPKLHFLVVNDSAQIRRIVVSLLKELRYIKVSEANDGAMALRSLRTARLVGAPINVMITDFAMPLMNGLELTRTIRQNPDTSNLAIMMITIEATPEHILAAKEAGVDSYLVRPFKAASLKKKLDALLLARGLREPEIDYGVFRP